MNLMESLEGAGSPLRMRGKASGGLPASKSLRITPAYAGKSGGEGPIDSFSEDHPCVCGEKNKLPVGTRYVRGSPLRMRGKGSPALATDLHSGITPAYAGKSGHLLVRS